MGVSMMISKGFSVELALELFTMGVSCVATDQGRLIADIIPGGTCDMHLQRGSPYGTTERTSNVSTVPPDPKKSKNLAISRGSFLERSWKLQEQRPIGAAARQPAQSLQGPSTSPH